MKWKKNFLAQNSKRRHRTQNIDSMDFRTDFIQELGNSSHAGLLFICFIIRWITELNAFSHLDLFFTWNIRDVMALSTNQRRPFSEVTKNMCVC